MYVDHTPEIVGDRLEAEASFWAEEAEGKEPSDEEKYEMRAAFGEGETIVNFFTGKTVYRT